MMTTHGNTCCTLLAEPAPADQGTAGMQGRRALDEALVLAGDGLLYDEAILMYLDPPGIAARLVPEGN